MKTYAIFVILVAILVNLIRDTFLGHLQTSSITYAPPFLQVSNGNGQPFSWIDTLLKQNATAIRNNDPINVQAAEAFDSVLRNFLLPSSLQSRAWWDPLNVFSGSATVEFATTSAAATTVSTVTTSAPVTTAKASFFNPFGFITDTFTALGQSVSNVGTSLVNLVTGGGGTTTTTPFPYPKVAAFFSEPGKMVEQRLNTNNLTMKPEIVKCLANVVNFYGSLLGRINTFLPNCIMGQKWSAVWVVPQLMGLLPALKLINVPTDVLKDCPYYDGCYLKVGLKIMLPQIWSCSNAFPFRLSRPPLPK